MARRAVLGVRGAFRDAPLQPAAQCNPLQPTATGNPLEFVAKAGIGRDLQERVDRPGLSCVVAEAIGTITHIDIENFKNARVGNTKYIILGDNFDFARYDFAP